MVDLLRRKIVLSGLSAPALLLPNREGYIADTELLGHLSVLLKSREISPEFYSQKLYEFSADFPIHPLSSTVAQMKIENRAMVEDEELLMGMIAKTASPNGGQVSGTGNIYMDEFGLNNWVDISTAFIPAKAGSSLDGAVIQCSFGFLNYVDATHFTRVVSEGYFLGNQTFQRLSFQIPREGEMRTLQETDQLYVNQELTEEVRTISSFQVQNWPNKITLQVDDHAKPFYGLMNISP